MDFFLSKIIERMIIMGTGGVIGILVVPTVLFMLGFRRLGPVAGSVAAKLMSFIAVLSFGMVKGLLGICYAIIQSAAMTGKFPWIGAILGVIVAYYYFL